MFDILHLKIAAWCSVETVLGFRQSCPPELLYIDGRLPAAPGLRFCCQGSLQCYCTPSSVLSWVSAAYQFSWSWSG